MAQITMPLPTIARKIVSRGVDMDTVLIIWLLVIMTIMTIMLILVVTFVASEFRLYSL